MRVDYRPAMYHEDKALIPIGDNAQRGIATVDIEDAWIEKYTWVLLSNGYVKAMVGGKEILMHRLLMQPDKNMTVDHRDGDRLNNQKSNLRVCTLTQNNLNKPVQSRTKSGYKGVEYHPKLNKWRARIRFEGKRYSLGCYDLIEDAAKAYEKAAKELFGEYAYEATK